MNQGRVLIRHQICWNLDLGLSTLQVYEKQLSVVYKPLVYFVTAVWIDWDNPPTPIIYPDLQAECGMCGLHLNTFPPVSLLNLKPLGYSLKMTWGSWVFLILALLSHQLQWWSNSKSVPPGVVRRKKSKGKWLVFRYWERMFFKK